jgi:hypothetical protein
MSRTWYAMGLCILILFAEPGATPNGGPAMQGGKPGATEEPPSVSRCVELVAPSDRRAGSDAPSLPRQGQNVNFCACRV